jgi:acid phosphatase
MLFRGKSGAARLATGRRVLNRAAAPAAVESLEPRELLSGTTSTGGPIVTPAHVVVVIEEDRYANAIGDTANMPYINQLAGTGLVYSNSHGLNTSSQEGEMSYLGLFSGSTQGVTDNAYHGPFGGGNLAQSLNNAAAGLSFASYAEAMPRAGDTTDNYAAEPGDPAYDDLYVRAYNPASQFSNVGTGKTNAQVNLTFASFPTTAAGYAALPTVSFVVPDTLHNTHGSNDTSPYATDPGEYNSLRQNADTWLQQNLNGYLQWARQNNSLLIVTGDEGDRAHNFAAGFATIVNGASNLFVAGTDSKSVTPYNLLRTVEDMYGLAPLGSSASAADYDTDATGRLAPTGSVTTPAATTTTLASSLNPATAGQNVTFTATVGSASGTPGGAVSFLDGTTQIGTGTLNASGVATFTTTSLAIGTHNLIAAYAGNANFAPGQSAAYAQTILPAWLASNSEASWNPLTHTLTVTGSAVINADPGPDAPHIVESGVAAQLVIQPATSPTDVHVGGISLASGAKLQVASVGAGRTHANHNVLVVGTLGATTDPTFSIDSTSKLDLADNDLVLHVGASDASGVAAYNNVFAPAKSGRRGDAGQPDGTWNGFGLDSSTATASDAATGYEQIGLAVVTNNALVTGPRSAWTVGSASESLAGGDVLVKYTYVGDYALEGMVGDDDAGILQVEYDRGRTNTHNWATGSTLWDGLADDNEAGVFQIQYGLGTKFGPQL